VLRFLKSLDEAAKVGTDRALSGGGRNTALVHFAILAIPFIILQFPSD
jgi:hypothetical protein